MSPQPALLCMKAPDSASPARGGPHPDCVGDFLRKLLRPYNKPAVCRALAAGAHAKIPAALPSLERLQPYAAVVDAAVTTQGLGLCLAHTGLAPRLPGCPGEGRSRRQDPRTQFTTWVVPSMNKALLRLAVISSAVLSASGCMEPLALEPDSMTLEVAKSEISRLQVSFTVRVGAWDGEASVYYRASACAASGELFLCVSGPFVENSVTASRVVQPIRWTEQQCGHLIVFEASLPNGEKAEATHVTCS